MPPSDSCLSPPSPPKHRTSILVEDQPDLRRLLKHRLETNGYACLKAANGVEPLSLIQQHPSMSLILSAYPMQSMNAPQLRQALRQNPMKRGIPFIPVTATRSDRLRHQALGEGARASLPTPYHRSEPFQLLEQGISTQGAWPAHLDRITSLRQYCAPVFRYTCSFPVILPFGSKGAHEDDLCRELLSRFWSKVHGFGSLPVFHIPSFGSAVRSRP